MDEGERLPYDFSSCAPGLSGMTVTYVTEHRLWMFLENLPHYFCNNVTIQEGIIIPIFTNEKDVA